MKVNASQIITPTLQVTNLQATFIGTPTTGPTTFYPPKYTTAALPTASTVRGLLVFDTTVNKLKFSNGTAWETVTSA